MLNLASPKKSSGFGLFLKTVQGRAYPRVVGMLREKTWMFFDIFLPLLSVSAFALMYKAIGAPEEYLGFVVIALMAITLERVRLADGARRQLTVNGSE